MTTFRIVTLQIIIGLLIALSSCKTEPHSITGIWIQE